MKILLIILFIWFVQLLIWGVIFRKITTDKEWEEDIGSYIGGSLICSVITTLATIYFLI